MDVNEKLKIAILRILNMNNLRLFGCMFYNFIVSIEESNDIIKQSLENLDITDPDLKIEMEESFKDFLTASIFIDDSKPHIIIYDSFIKEKSVEELTFVILHEILHFLKGDTYRGTNKDQTIYNLAADHIINNSLIKDINDNKLQKVAEPKDRFLIDKIKQRNMSTEEVYDYLLNTVKINPLGNSSVKIFPKSGGEEDAGKAININISEIEIDNKKSIHIEDINSSKSETENLEQKQTTESLKSEARALMNQESISKGMATGSLKDLITKIIEVEIPWEKLLERALLTKIVPDHDNRIWTNPRKRLRAHGYVFPGRGTSKKASIAAICIDTSGSISKKDLKKFSSIIIQSFSKFDELWILKHDIKIHQNIRIKTSDVDASDIISKYYGRGGTSHKYIFKEIQKSFEKKKEDIGIVIILTDFESDIEHMWARYSWTRRIPVSVVLTRNNPVPKYIDPHPVLIKDK